ncbi:MAG: histidine triad nucleotide-binding protein [Pseudomonadales bacterium]|jgi:histidine triad (HIT) family protein
MNSDCLFCKILNEDIPADIVYSDDELLAFNDISPQTPTHVLIIPKTHIATVNDLTEAQSGIIGKMILCAKTLAGETGISESGYRLVMNCNEQGGQTVFHIHLHLMGGRQLRALG